MNLIEPFSSITKSDTGTFGGKTASLGDLFQAGLPVPDGFGISAEAHRRFKNQPFTPEFSSRLQAAFARLKCQRVAVRSSALAEDAADASWAGQLETFLNVSSKELEDAIRNCWRSIESTRVEAYARDKNLTADDLLVGVAVQAMVDSEAAGVMFTTNPVTGDQGQLMIEAAYGLGELVVGGAVTPDNYLVDTTSNSLIKSQIFTKDQMLIYADGASRLFPVADELKSEPVLTKPQILELAAIGTKIARHYHSPQDIEWARRAGKFYIVQARPITTLHNIS